MIRGYLIPTDSSTDEYGHLINEEHKFDVDKLGDHVVISINDLCGIVKTLKDLTYNPKTDIFENIDPRVLNLADELGVQ